MKMEKLELQADSVVFYSPRDEAQFFGWLDQMECVMEVVGRGRIIYIQIDKRRVDAEVLRDILAFFQRYRIAMEQLKVFDSEAFSTWFRRSDAYWYRSVFGARAQSNPDGRSMSCLHDLHIDGLRIEDRRRLALSLSTECGRYVHEVIFDDIVRLSIDGFSMQNIILDLSVFTEREASFEFDRACALLGVDPADPHELDGTGCIVLIEATIGAEIACLMSQHWQLVLHQTSRNVRA